MTGRCTATSLYTAAAKVNLRTHKVFYLDAQGQVRRVRHANNAPDEAARALVVPADHPAPTPGDFAATIDLPAGAFATTVQRGRAAGRHGRASTASVADLVAARRYNELAATLSHGHRRLSPHAVRLALNPLFDLPGNSVDALAPVLIAGDAELPNLGVLRDATDPTLLWWVFKQYPGAVLDNRHCPREIFEQVIRNFDRQRFSWMDVEVLASNPALPFDLAQELCDPWALPYEDPENYDGVVEHLVSGTPHQEILRQCAEYHLGAAFSNPHTDDRWLSDKLDGLIDQCPPSGDEVLPHLDDILARRNPDFTDRAARWAYTRWKTIADLDPLTEVFAYGGRDATALVDELLNQDPGSLYAVIASATAIREQDKELPGVAELSAVLSTSTGGWVGQLPEYAYHQLLNAASGSSPLDVFRRRVIACHRRSPDSVSARLARDPEPDVRRATVSWTLPDQALEQLCADPHPEVAFVADQERQRRRLEETHNPPGFEQVVAAAEAAKLTDSEADLFHQLLDDWDGPLDELADVVRAANQ